MRCITCGRKVRGSSGLIFSQYTVRCKCGTRLKILPGMFRDKIVDWETVEERERRKKVKN